MTIWHLQPQNSSFIPWFHRTSIIVILCCMVFRNTRSNTSREFRTLQRGLWRNVPDEITLHLIFSRFIGYLWSVVSYLKSYFWLINVWTTWHRIIYLHLLHHNIARIGTQLKESSNIVIIMHLFSRKNHMENALSHLLPLLNGTNFLLKSNKHPLLILSRKSWKHTSTRNSLVT